MKLLIATGTFPPDASGPATYVSELVPVLLKAGWQVKVVTYGDGPADYPYPVIRVTRNVSLIKRYWLYFLAVWRQAAWADLVYIQGPVSEGLPGALGARTRGKKYVLKVVGDYAWEQAKVQYSDQRGIDEFQTTSHLDTKKIRCWRIIQRQVAKHAQVVITPSQYLAKIVKGWGVDERKIKVIYNAYAPITVKDGKQTLRQKLGLNTPTIISIGRLVPWKGFVELIKILPEIHKQVQDVHLLIIGDGPDKTRLENIINDYHLQNNVILLGQLPYHQTQSYIKAADLLVLNSSYEGLSHVLLEGMAVGVPIVATDVGGNGEVIQNGVNGLLVSFNNQQALIAAIIKCLTDKELVAGFIDSYSDILKQFEHQRLVEQTMSVLTKV